MLLCCRRDDGDYVLRVGESEPVTRLFVELLNTGEHAHETTLTISLQPPDSHVDYLGTDSHVSTTTNTANTTERFLRRGTRSGFCRPDWPSVETLAEDAADVLFRRVLRIENHLLYTLLPDKNSHGYNLRQRRHERTLVSNHDQRNFIDRQLHKHSY